MPTKAELYAQMAEKVATQLTGSWQEWAGFLTTAARLYKYPFHEQLMIYAHLFIPQIVLRTGGGVRSLGIDHQLLMERVLVKAGSSSEKPCPFLPAPRELCCHLVRHLRI